MEYLNGVEETVKAELQCLRNVQSVLAFRLSMMEKDFREFTATIDVLETMEPDRKCYRLYDNVIRLYKAKEILEQITESKAVLQTQINKTKEDLNNKTEELAKFLQEHNIKILYHLHIPSLK